MQENTFKWKSKPNQIQGKHTQARRILAQKASQIKCRSHLNRTLISKFKTNKNNQINQTGNLIKPKPEEFKGLNNPIY